MLTQSYMRAKPSSRCSVGLPRAAALILLLSGSGAACGDGDSKPSGPGGVSPERAGTAGAKFCSNLVFQSGSQELSLEIGTPPVRLTATGGKCSVEKGVNCASIPAGLVPWRLVRDGQTVLLGASEITDGEQRIYVMDVDDNRQAEMVQGVLQPGLQCSQFDPFEGGVPSDGGAPPPLPPGRAELPGERSFVPVPLDAIPHRHLGLERHAPR